MLQAICKCGRIAEVRRQKNGSKLAYTYCKACKTGTRSLANSKLVLAEAKEDIGVFGEFPNSSSENGQSEQSTDYVPPSEHLPDNLENDDEDSESETDDKPSKGGKILGCALGGILALGLAAFGYHASTSNKG